MNSLNVCNATPRPRIIIFIHYLSSVEQTLERGFYDDATHTYPVHRHMKKKTCRFWQSFRVAVGTWLRNESKMYYKARQDSGERCWHWRWWAMANEKHREQIQCASTSAEVHRLGQTQFSSNQITSVSSRGYPNAVCIFVAFEITFTISVIALVAYLVAVYST